MSEPRRTLVRQPPQDTTKAPIENALELTDLSIIGPVSCDTTPGTSPPLYLTVHNCLKSVGNPYPAQFSVFLLFTLFFSLPEMLGLHTDPGHITS